MIHCIVDYSSEQRERANRMDRDAVKAGILIRPDTCDECKNQRPEIHGHHHNGYSDEHALDVQWLCRDCHFKAHTSSEGGKARTASMTSEEWSAFGRAGAAALTPEQRSRGGQRGGKAVMESLTFEERSRRNKKAWETRRARGEALGRDDVRTPEEKSASAKKSWETRRANGNVNTRTSADYAAAAKKAWATRRARGSQA